MTDTGSDMHTDREFVAFHEAGHAVAAAVLRVTIERITIAPSGDVAGHVLHDYGVNMNEIIYSDDGANRQWALERTAIIALAGEVAQRRFRAESVTEEHAGGDRLAVHQALDHLAGWHDQELRDAWWRVLELRTDRLISQHWHTVQGLASLLLQHTTIEGEEEISRAMRRAAETL